jgi:hypothetical protein
VIGHHQAEDGITEELEPFVRIGAGRLRTPRPMGQGAGEQLAVEKLTAQSPAERIELRVVCRQEAPSLATT